MLANPAGSYGECARLIGSWTEGDIRPGLSGLHKQTVIRFVYQASF